MGLPNIQSCQRLAAISIGSYGRQLRMKSWEGRSPAATYGRKKVLVTSARLGRSRKTTDSPCFSRKVRSCIVRLTPCSKNRLSPSKPALWPGTLPI